MELHTAFGLRQKGTRSRQGRRRETAGSLAMIEFLRIDARQRKSKDGSVALVGRNGDPPAVRFDNSSRNRQANPHAALFRRGERLEQGRSDLGSDPVPSVGDVNGYHVVGCRSGGDYKLAID
jgi:hypothetical protein